MKKKNNLAVRPVRRYPKPGYPSWQDPNPLENPYAKPYPFTQKALNWLAASGLCGALFVMPGAEKDAGISADQAAQVEGDTLKNPFAFEFSGLPFMPPSFGTGLPDRLTDKDARAVIDSVFRSEGFHLKKTMLRVGDGYVPVDGFDEEEGIGYVWMGWQVLGDDLVLNYDNYRYDKHGKMKHGKRSRFPDNELERIDFYVKKSLDKLLTYKNPDQPTADFIVQLKSMLEQGETEWTDDNLWKYYAYVLSSRVAWEKKDANFSPAILEYVEKILAMEPGDSKRQQLDQAIDVTNIYSRLKNEIMAKALLRAAKKKDSKACFERLESLQTAWHQTKDAAEKEAIMTAIAEGEKDWKPAAELARQRSDELKISQGEALALEASANRGEAAIALVSQQDRRFAFYGTRAESEAWRQKDIEQLKKLHPEMDSLEIEQNAGATIWGHHGNYKEDVLKKLEEEVKNYIQWARHQRGY